MQCARASAARHTEVQMPRQQDAGLEGAAFWCCSLALFEITRRKKKEEVGLIVCVCCMVGFPCDLAVAVSHRSVSHIRK